MITLHDIRATLPYPNTPTMTQEIFDDFERDQDGLITGRLFRMWIEDDHCVGLWSAEDDEGEPFIIDLANDYGLGSSFLQEDANYINTHPGGSSYNLYEGHVMDEGRGSSYRLIDIDQQYLFE